MKSPVPVLLAAVMLFGGCTGVSQLSTPKYCNVDPAVFMDTDYIYTQLERMINQ